MIKIIVAYTKNNRVIGNKGKIPWNIPDDMRHFKSVTKSDPVIMGRRTYDSLPYKFRPLPERPNIVVSRSIRSGSYGLEYCQSIEDAIKLALSYKTNNAWIIGGAAIYQEALNSNVVDEIVASEIIGEYNGDVFFPELDDSWVGDKIKSYDEFDIIRYTRKHYENTN